MSHAKAVEKVETLRAGRAAAAEEIAQLKKRRAQGGGERTVARLNAKLQVERALAVSLKQKLDREKVRAARLAAELKTAAAEARGNRLEADRARGQEQRVLAELALAGERSA